MGRSSKSMLMLGAGALSLGVATAQTEERDAPQQAEEIVVQGEIVYRDVSETIAPTLVFDTDYFQRFEPLTAGDALKRVPGVAFVGTDILEADSPQLRGLGIGYTQILINGEQIPGSGDDRSFFLDRIPAELIERVEVIRSSSASRSGDAVAGALNIVLRDGYSLDGGYLRAGIQRFPDGRIGGIAGAVYGGEAGPGRFLIGVNVQDRRNPKLKSSTRFEPNDAEADFEFANREDQTDTRDGTDYSFNASYQIPEFAGGELDLSAYYVHTDRLEDEDSVEYADPTSLSTDDILTINANDEDVRKDNYTLAAGYNRPALGGEFKARISFSEFIDDLYEFEIEQDLEPFTIDGEDFSETEVAGEALFTDRTDQEIKAKLAQEFAVNDLVDIEVGVDFRLKTRDTELREDDDDASPASAFDDIPPYQDEDAVDRSSFELVRSEIKEDRIDPYMQVNGSNGGAIDWEVGLRYETTDLEVELDEDGEITRDDKTYEIWLPSAHVKAALSERDTLSVSFARTVRRAQFNFLAPEFLDGEYGDNDFRGNPQLDAETAWGLDVGWERQLGRTGVFGVNAFVRGIDDLIELTNTLDPSEEALDAAEDDGIDPESDEFDPDSFVYTPENVGEAVVYGIEFDISTPLTRFGLPNTGLFANYAYLDSEVEDELGKRRINNQAKFVFNGGFIHDIPPANMALGVTYREQGDAVDRLLAEEVLIQYGPNLEAFVEKSFGERFTLRLAGQNLLDETKDEIFDKFDTVGEQLSGEIGDYDELEFESEEAGPVFTLIGRYAF